MSLAAGTRVGSYTITSLLGAGGMGEVYRARDAKLNRDVAIKVLPPSLSADAERLSRFRREALLLATLKHPNIAQIYGLEELDGMTALVLELVEGEDLARRVSSGAIPITESLAIARQIAEALEAIHELGIVHRDLKPANIKLTEDDIVKVLDFGLAKSADGMSDVDVMNSPTISVHATEAGVILGTAPYMSPEQARGKAVDRRTDLWALGCILFEMLTGKRAFPGDDATDTIVAIVSKEPDWNALPGLVPRGVTRLLQRCLEKRQRERLDSATAFRLALDDVRDESRDLKVPEIQARGSARVPYVVATVACVIAAAAVAAWRMNPGADSGAPPLRKFELPIENLDWGLGYNPVLSPQGDRIAYNADGALWIRDLEKLVPVRVAGSTRGEALFWSPDGRTLAFGTNKKLWTVSIDSLSTPAPLCDVPDTGRVLSGSWHADGEMVFSAWRGSIYKVNGKGGAPVRVVAVDPAREIDFHEVSFLPRSKDLLFVSHLLVGATNIESLTGDVRKTLRTDASVPTYSSTGHLLYGDENGYWAAPFSAATHEITGTPFSIDAEFIVANVSANGHLLAVSVPHTMNQLVWVDRAGKIAAPVGEPQLQVEMQALSPDGTKIATVAESAEHVWDVWVHDVALGTRLRLTTDPEINGYPSWSPLGDRIVFSSGNAASIGTISTIRPDGSAPSGVLTKGVAPTMSANYIVFRTGQSDLHYVRTGAEGAQASTHFVATPAEELRPILSPDGQWVAYGSNESGRHEVYVRRFPSGDERILASRNGGREPRWRRDGKELFYLQGDTMMAVALELGKQPPAVGAAKELFRLSNAGVLPAALYDVTADGSRFLMVRTADNARATPMLVLVQNWFNQFSGATAPR